MDVSKNPLQITGDVSRNFIKNKNNNSISIKNSKSFKDKNILKRKKYNNNNLNTILEDNKSSRMSNISNINFDEEKKELNLYDYKNNLLKNNKIQKEIINKKSIKKNKNFGDEINVNKDKKLLKKISQKNKNEISKNQLELIFKDSYDI
jgi:hypothetical protein